MCRLTGQKLLVETPAIYASPGMQAYIQQELHRPCKRWVVDVLNGTREASEVRLRTGEFVLLPDTERVNRYGRGPGSPWASPRSRWGVPDGPAPVHETPPPRRLLPPLRSGVPAAPGPRPGTPDTHGTTGARQGTPGTNQLRLHPQWHWRACEGLPPASPCAPLASPPGEQVNWLAIATEPGLRSLRDLRGRHVPMLRRMLHRCRRRIHEETGVAPEEVMAYVHYPPSVYQLHVHFAFPYAQYNHRDVFRIHSLANVINNLQIDPEYYAKARLQVSLGRNSALHQICAAAREEGPEPRAPARRKSV